MVIHSNLTKDENRVIFTCTVTIPICHSLALNRALRQTSLLHPNPCLSSYSTLFPHHGSASDSALRLHEISRILISGTQVSACIQVFICLVSITCRALGCNGGPAGVGDGWQESWGWVKGGREGLGCSQPRPEHSPGAGQQVCNLTQCGECPSCHSPS